LVRTTLMEELATPDPPQETGVCAEAGHDPAAGRTVKAQTTLAHSETALGALVDQAGFGVVVVGARGHSRARSLLIGSATTKMIRSCKVPVVLIP
jgi:nucleotide-binding universal stress UspA family protein